MTQAIVRKPGVLLASILLVGASSLGACASTKYVDEQIAGVNTRIDAVDAKAQNAAQRADAASSAAQAAAGEARTANQRIDQVSARVDALERQRAAPVRSPRN